jgi:hypothetical protein
VTTAAQRPDLVPLLEDFNGRPAFMRQDPVAPPYYGDAATAYPSSY